MIIYNNRYCEPEQPARRAVYICPDCKTRYREFGIVRKYFFVDGETRIQCSLCPFHEDEVIFYSEPIYEPSEMEVIEDELL
jgi:hypothetical protein